MSAVTPIATSIAAGAPAPRGPRPPRLMRRLRRRPLGALALLILAIIVIACILAPIVAPYGPYASDFTHELAGPGAKHLLGTDELGRDILSRMLYGGRSTLLAAAEATAIAIFLGTTLGVLAGYRRGATDRAVSLGADLMMTMPVLVVLIVVVSVFPSSPYPAMVPLGVMLSAAPIRVLRAVTLAVREEGYISAARVSGLSHRQIMIRHVLPRIRGTVVVQATLVAAVAVLIASGLAFLGFGLKVPQPSWGSIVAEAASQYQLQPWFLVPTGGAIALTVLCLGLVGDALRDATAERWGGAARRRVRAPRPAVDHAIEAADAPVVDGDAILTVRNLAVAVADSDGMATTLVDGLSFSLHRGRTLALVGESGCGKSVTSRAALGMAPSGGWLTGSVVLDSIDLIRADRAQLRSVRGRRIAFIGQEPHASLDPTQTVGAGLAELVRLYRGGSRSSSRAAAIELLTRVRINDPARVAGLYPHQISGGMAQRVMIARALAGEPDVLIADEPTTALDVTVQAEILALLRSLQMSTRVAILLVTHDWGVVAGLADDVLVMYSGQAVEYAGVDRIFAHPQHPYSDLLLQANPERATSGSRLPAIPGTVARPGEWPSGCRFAPRCPYATDTCRTGPVALVESGDGQLARCVRVKTLDMAR